MANNRHSFISFFPSDWKSGVAALPRLHRSVYFDMCCEIWDSAQPVDPLNVVMLTADLPNGQQIIDDLVSLKKLERLPDGSITNARALDTAKAAFDAWQRMSKGGKARGLQGSAQGGSQGACMGDAKGAPEEPRTSNLDPKDTSNDVSSSAIGISEAAGMVLDSWNAMVSGCDAIKAVKAMNDKRKASLKARIDEHGLEAILAIIPTIPQSAFLRGQNDRGWVANMDWLLQPSSMMKLMEGQYHGQRSGKRSGWLG